ncbi:glycoside hydrolase family 2 TIM barrel-domain containing protein [Marinicrinis lubricantis]
MSVPMEAHLEKVRFTPDIDRNEIELRCFIAAKHVGASLQLQVNISFQGESVSEDRFRIHASEELRRMKLSGLNDHGLDRFWSPECPNLYDVELILLDGGRPIDRVQSYFGMRKISIESGKVNLNNRPYRMKLVLDQGYFPDGNLTPPSDEAIRRDVELTKAMGFNGARKHQKIEDPRYLYWCDKLGLLVWGEAPNAYDYSETYVGRMTKEWQEAIERDYNHPSIVVWVPLNESWGVPNIQIDRRQQQHALAMYYLTKLLDSTRLVVSNDGWEMVETDLYNIHDYEWRRDVLEQRYSSAEEAARSMPENRCLSVGGFVYSGQPILVTEFGGIAYKKSDWEGWGYSGAENDEDFAKRLQDVIEPLRLSPVVQGYCYTQLTDVEQEIDRQPKIPLEAFK